MKMIIFGGGALSSSANLAKYYCAVLLRTMVLSNIINYFLFKPPPSQPYTFTNDVVHLKTKQGTKLATTILERKSAKTTILYSHGNAEDLSVIFPYLLKLAFELDSNVVSYDYNGYGESTGSPSERSCYDNIVTVYDYMTVDLGIPRESIVLYGRSLGSGPTCYLAERLAKEKQSIAGVILYAPFTSVFRVVFPHHPITMFGDPFPNIDRIAQIQCPVMIIHGGADHVVPCSHGQALVQAAQQRCLQSPNNNDNNNNNKNNKNNNKVVFFTRKGFGHNDVPTLIGMEMLHAKRNFIKSLCE